MLSVSRLSVTPVRGLALLHPNEVLLERHGPLDDRRYSIMDTDLRIVDGTKHGTLVQIRAELSHDPERLTLTFPNGDIVSGEIALGEPMRSVIYDRPFSARPVIGPWAEAIATFVGRAVQLVRAERATDEPDRNPVSIVSEASVEELSRQSGVDSLDARRFRMLLQIAGARPHEEDEWLGGQVQIGEAIVHVTKPDPRCVVTTQDPETGLRDFLALHAIKAYRGLREGRHIDFGVYAEVVRPGLLRVGDPVRPLSAASFPLT